MQESQAPTEQEGLALDFNSDHIQKCVSVTCIRRYPTKINLSRLGFAIFEEPNGDHPWMVLVVPQGWSVVVCDLWIELWDQEDELRFVDFRGFAHYEPLFFDVLLARKRLEKLQSMGTDERHRQDEIFELVLNAVDPRVDFIPLGLQDQRAVFI